MFFPLLMTLATLMIIPVMLRNNSICTDLVNVLVLISHETAVDLYCGFSDCRKYFYNETKLCYLYV